jgi:hypothetical protein
MPARAAYLDTSSVVIEQLLMEAAEENASRPLSFCRAYLILLAVSSACPAEPAKSTEKVT